MLELEEVGLARPDEPAAPRPQGPEDVHDASGGKEGNDDIVEDIVEGGEGVATPTAGDEGIATPTADVVPVPTRSRGKLIQIPWGVFIIARQISRASKHLSKHVARSMPSIPPWSAEKLLLTRHRQKSTLLQ